jgi:hypothetical protein
MARSGRTLDLIGIFFPRGRLFPFFRSVAGGAPRAEICKLGDNVAKFLHVIEAVA